MIKKMTMTMTTLIDLMIKNSVRPRVRCAAALLIGLIACAPFARTEIVLAQKPANEAETPGHESVVPDPEGEAETARMDVLEFLNGDRIRGTFYSADPARGVRWGHPAIRQVLEVDLGSIASVRLNRPQGTNNNPGQTCLVQLTNDDELLGELVGLDGETIRLKTWYAGALTIPRKMARTISPGQAGTSAVYEGPEGLEGWKVKNNSGGRRAGGGPTGWRFKGRAFYGNGNGSVGRDVGVPPNASIEFDLAWNGYLQLGFSFYSENLETYGGNCYMIQFSSGSVYMQRMTKDGNTTNLGHSEAQLLAQRSNIRVRLLASKEQKTLTLLLNGEQVKQWTERGEFSPGTGMAFFQQGQGAVRISGIRVEPWDGKYEAATKSDAPSKEDMVKLANNDKISGDLKSILDDKMSFGTEFATLEVPLSRIDVIEFAGEKADRAASNAADIRAVFGNRGHLTFSLDHWDDRQISGSSPNFGPVKFQPTAFTRIDFNLDKRKGESDPTAWDNYEGGYPLLLDGAEH